MPKLITAALVAMLIVAPNMGFADSASTGTPPPTHPYDTWRALMVSLGAVSGMSVIGVMTVTIMTRATLTLLGSGVLALAASLVGGLAGDYFYNYFHQ